MFMKTYLFKDFGLMVRRFQTRIMHIFIGLLASTISVASFADCGCDYVVPAGQHETNGATLGIQPGDVICLQAGTSYGNLKFTNLQGTADNPIVIRNCGGQVAIDLNTKFSFAMKTINSRYFRITGSGDASYEHGIVLRGANLGLALDELSSDFEVDHLEVSGSGFAGIMAKTDPNCGKPYDRSKFTMRNIDIHHNYVHDTGGEGLYVGNSFYANGRDFSCGKLYPHAIHNAKVHHNTVKRTGWDGIQVGSATQGCEVYSNVVEDVGLKMSGTHGNGIQLGEGTGGRCYNNIIKNSYANGMIVLGLGDNVIFNNIIVNSGGYGAFIDSRPPASPGNGFKFINNTIVGVSENGVRIYAQLSNLQNVVKNNIIVGATLPVKLLHNGVTNVEVSNNLSVPNVSGAGFVDAGAGNYQLTTSSPAVNAGSNVSQYGIVSDFKGTPRPQGSAYDIGAYEFQSASAPVSLWLEAECGAVGSSWQTITDAAASNGKYVMYPQGNVSKNPPSGNSADQVTFTVNVPQAASYFLLARIKAIDNARNSFWFKIDNQSWIEWWEGMTLSQSFAWNLAPGGAFALSAGSHTISFAYREGGTQLDKLVLSTSSTLPSDKGVAVTACTPPSLVVTANAGADQTVALGKASVELYGIGKSPNPFRVYLWEKVSGPSVTLTTRGANATLTNLQVGSYEFKFTATDSEGNSGSDEVKVIVTASNARTADRSSKPTVERTPDALTSVLVYPNPVDASLKVNLGTKQPASLSLSDLSGRMLFHQRVVPSSTGEITISTDEFPEGMYLLRIERQDQVQLTKLLIKH